MPSETWEKFLSNFGNDSTDDLVTVRDNKIGTARAEVVAQIKRITDVGLVDTLLTNQLRIFDQNRTTANQRNTNTAKAEALLVVKDNMRALAARARVEADRRIAQLETDLGTAKRRVSGKIGKAENHKVPVLRTSLTLPLANAIAAQKLALAKPTDGEKLDALNAIDLDPLNQALEATKKGETCHAALTSMVKMAKGNIDKLYPCGEKNEFTTKLDTIEERIEQTLEKVDFDYVVAELGRILKDFEGFFTPLGKMAYQHRDLRVRIRQANKSIDTVVKTAESKQTGKSTTKVLDEAFTAVVTAQQNAMKRVRHDDQADDLEAIDLAPLKKAIQAARDLDQGCPELYAAIPKVLAKLPDNNKRAELTSAYQDLAPEYGLATNRTDLEVAREAFKTLKAKLTRLMDQVLSAGGDDAYEEALEARFGISVSKVDGASVHLKKTYDMLSLVPESHVGHEKCAKVHFDNNKKGGASYSKSKITMGNYGSHEQYLYTPGGLPALVNGFNVSMLHEIGHAVDDKYGVMKRNGSSKKYGGWKEYGGDVGEIADKAAKHFKYDKSYIASYLSKPGGNYPKPEPAGGAEADEWDQRRLEAEAWCDSIRSGNTIWYSATETKRLQIGGRVYQEAYSGKWVSYEFAARSQGVRGYQFRAPGEWFADIYAAFHSGKMNPKHPAREWLEKDMSN